MNIKLFFRMIMVIMAGVLITSSTSGCGSKFNGTEEQNDTPGASASDSNQNGSSSVKHPKVQIEMEDGGKMVLELYPEYAPDTVKNFIQLAEKGFYNGLTFHRIIKGFMIQGGDPQGTGMGGSENTIKGEFASNGFTQNTLKHTRGVISMARSRDPNSASSQFFIMDADNSGLDGSYAAFGKLIEGSDTLDKIADTPVGPNADGSEISVPKNVVRMKTVTVLEK